ncbi:MAG: YceI family protein [Puniceicoccaceae bacterium]|nr:MAG: YceI family protein [Puniceicoccaceae bacterium]
MKKIHLSLVALTATLISLVSLGASAKVYDFKDPKGVNNIRFDLDAPLEAISGTGNGITGTISFDPAHPENTTGEIILAAESLIVPNSTMREHLHGADWLNVKKKPSIVFTAASVDHFEQDGNVLKAHVSGSLQLNGTTREVTVPVTFTHLPGRLGDRTRGLTGDLLVVRASFAVNRSDYGIRPGQNLDTVAEEIQISLALAGAAPDA